MRLRFRSPVPVAAVCAAALVLIFGCDSPPAEPRTLSGGEQGRLVELAVDAEQLSPSLRRTIELLSREDVAVQADLPDLGQTLDTSGYLGGVKVEYRGDSRRLTGVESQVLMFSSKEGAAEFSDYLAQHAAGFFGDPIRVKRIVVAGRDGWRIDPPVCDCAGAQPLSAGALRIGTKVIVLQITGPKADSALVQELLATSVKDSA